MLNKFLKQNFNKLLKPYIIAEIGVNHECSLTLAKKMIIDAKKAGADAIKLQAYKANKIASKNSPHYWDLKKEKTQNQYRLFKKFDAFGKKEFSILHKFCKEMKIDFLCTPFDLEFVDVLNPLVPAFKISSSDLNNKPLIKKICKMNKPIILSTGASTLKEIKETISWIKPNGNLLILLHCVLNYPTKDHDANLGVIKTMIKKFPRNIIGYSDHTLPDPEMKNLTTAWLLGAKIIEKHFTFDKKKEGNDHYHSMDKKDLLKFNKNVSEILNLVGNENKKILLSEKKSRINARRAIYTKVKLLKGCKLNKENIICKRPFKNGIAPKYFNFIIGKKINKNLNKDTIITWKDL
jgi:sialic acid synthase SpsE